MHFIEQHKILTLIIWTTGTVLSLIETITPIFQFISVLLALLVGVLSAWAAFKKAKYYSKPKAKQNQKKPLN